MDSRSRKVMLAFAAAAALAIAPIAAAAQAKPAASVDGKWDMTVTGPDGNPMSVKATFKQEGKKLTGTLISPQGEVPLEGEYAEGAIKFGISVPGDSGPMSIAFTGNMKDDGSMGGTASGPFGEIPWSAVKAK